MLCETSFHWLSPLQITSFQSPTDCALLFNKKPLLVTGGRSSTYHTKKKENCCHQVFVPPSAVSDGLTVPFGHRLVPGAGRKHEAVAPFPLLWTGKKRNQIKVALKIRKCVYLQNWSPRFRRAGSQCFNLAALWARLEFGAPSRFRPQNVPSPKAGVPTAVKMVNHSSWAACFLFSPCGVSCVCWS